ncbi:MAG TPA: methylthioribulose 1-phosphate dehydratase [Candidatus Acidoferrum sp.]|nr:methylthioribulose 1-phosphate dehydratase [Candidatus Acidoferrum sp.]
MAPAQNRSAVAKRFADFGREFHSRGWALGTSGNYSAVLQKQPLRLLITASGRDKSALSQKDFLEIDQHGRVLQGTGKPSAETFLHLAVVRARRAGCVLHTHSVWSTLLSERHAEAGGLAISGYEMLKGLEAVKTHEHREWVPIFPNRQDIPALAQRVGAELDRDPASHGFLLCGHGLYTWGGDPAEARRHVEIFEFLLEVTGRRELGPPNS